MNEINTTTGRLRQFVAQAMFDVRKDTSHPDHCTQGAMATISKGLDSITKSMQEEYRYHKQQVADGKNVAAMGQMRVDDPEGPTLDGRGSHA